jgi:3-mercaptopyruvate sulfurtransferase SseA
LAFENIRSSDLRLMNGGIEKWTAENRPVTIEVSAVTPLTYQAQ